MISTFPSCHTAVALIGGRFGPSRTTSSRASTRLAPCGRSGRRTRARRRVRASATLPPNAPPFASGDTGSPPGSHHDASRLEVRRLDPRVARRTPPSGGTAAAASGGAGVGGRAPALHLARERARLVRATRRPPTDSPARRSTASTVGPGRQRHRDERVTWRGVVGEPALTERHRRTDALRDPTFELRHARGRGRDRARRPPTVAAVVLRSPRRPCCQPVQRHRCAARPDRASGCRAPRAAAARTTIPGVQNPHCDPPRRHERGGQSRHASSGSSPSTVVTARPATRAAGVTHATRAFAVDEHGATATLALRCAAVLDRDDAEPLPQAPRAATRPARRVDVDAVRRCT